MERRRPLWVMMMMEDEEAQAHACWSTQTRDLNVSYLLMDSGAFNHVAPPEFAPSFPIRAWGGGQKVYTATGNCVSPLGRRKVPMYTVSTAGLQEVEIDFVVVPGLKRPILSVCELTRKGYNVVFRGDYQLAQVSKGGVGLNLEKRGDMYYLKVGLKDKTLGTQEVMQGLLAPVEDEERGEEDQDQEREESPVVKIKTDQRTLQQESTKNTRGHIHHIDLGVQPVWLDEDVMNPIEVAAESMKRRGH